MHYKKLSYKIDSKKPYLFIGSKVRGALGYALKEEVCVNPSFECKDCFAAKECTFYKFYEEQNTTHQYRLDFKLYTSKYKFSLLLFEDAKNDLQALHKAVLRSLKEEKSVEFKHKTKTFKESKQHAKVIKLHFVTPLRIKKQNKFATKDIELLDILLSIQRRDFTLKGKKFEKSQIDLTCKVEAKNLRYQELTRRSNKQNTKMNLGGLMGEMIISNVNNEVYNLLKLGEVIGVGKSTVFGLGKIKVEDLV